MRCLLLQIQKQKHITTSNVKSQGHWLSQKENNSPQARIKGKKYYNLTDKEFKILTEKIQLQKAQIMQLNQE